MTIHYRHVGSPFINAEQLVICFTVVQLESNSTMSEGKTVGEGHASQVKSAINKETGKT